MKYFSVDEINEFIKQMNLNKNIEKQILLDKNEISEEIEKIWSELANFKKRRRNKGKEKSHNTKYEISQNFDLDFVYTRLFEIRKEANTERTTNKLTSDKKVKKNFKVTLLKYFSVDEINEFIKKMNLNKEIEKQMLLDKNKTSQEIEIIMSELTNSKKRRRNKEKGKENNIKIIRDTIKEKPLLGRKRKGDNSIRKRNKYDTYNIIKKIKNKIIHYLLLFINNLIKSFYTIEQINNILLDLNLPKIKSKKPFQLIKKIRHDIYSKKTKRDENLYFLSLTIGEYLSNVISKKYHNVPPNSNNLIISRLVQDKTNKDIFDFIFNKLNIEEWLNILLNKKDFNSFEINLNVNQIIILKEHSKKINSLLFDILNNNDDNYYHCFTLIIYNLKEYFTKLEGRKRKKKTKDPKIDKVDSKYIEFEYSK